MDYCCNMRRYYQMGVVGIADGDPPIEAVDFVVTWEPKMMFRIKFCPFCGKDIPEDAPVREQE